MASPGPKRGARYPLENLEAILHGHDLHMRHETGNLHRDTDRVLPGYVAQVCGVSRTSVHRWRAEGLTAWAADKAAIAIGLHPVIIWSDWAEGGTPDATHDGLPRRRQQHACSTSS